MSRRDSSPHGSDQVVWQVLVTQLEREFPELQSDHDMPLWLLTAIISARRRLVVYEGFGPDHPDTLLNRGRLASLVSAVVFEQLLADQARVLEPDHPDRALIASLTAQSGDLASALKEASQILADQERADGPDHPDTLQTRAMIASLTARAGDLPRAIALAEEVLADQERVLGSEHRDTHQTRRQIAWLTASAGDLPLAITLAQDVHADEERALGTDHFDSRRTRALIASLTARAGDLPRAIALAKEVLAISPVPGGSGSRISGRARIISEPTDDRPGVADEDVYPNSGGTPVAVDPDNLPVLTSRDVGRHRARVAANFDNLVDQFTPSLGELDPVPYALVSEARRRAALRTELLASGAFTYKALAEGRGLALPAVRQWVRRARERHELFTVSHDNETLVPALLLDADFSPRRPFQPVIAALAEAGEDGWGLWAWLVHPTPWLDGTVPAAELDRNPEAVAEAARRRASNAA